MNRKGVKRETENEREVRLIHRSEQRGPIRRLGFKCGVLEVCKFEEEDILRTLL